MKTRYVLHYAIALSTSSLWILVLDFLASPPCDTMGDRAYSWLRAGIGFLCLPQARRKVRGRPGKGACRSHVSAFPLPLVQAILMPKMDS